MADLHALLQNTTIHGSIRTRAKDEVFQACDQFVGHHHIFLENEDRDFHYVAFDEFEKIHTEINHSDDIADVVSECVLWWCERNRLGIPCPDDMYIINY